MNPAIAEQPVTRGPSSWFISPPAVTRIWKRHLRVFLQAWFVRVFTPLTEPIFYFVGFGFGMGAFVESIEYHGQQMDYLTFVAPGMVALSILYPPFLEASYGSFIRFKYSLTWNNFLGAPLTFADIVAAELLWAVTKGLLSGVATAVVAALFGAMAWQAIPLLILPILVGAFFTAALGFAAAAYTRQIDDLNIAVFLLVVPMFTFSGTFFPREMLPQSLQFAASLLPFSVIVDFFRWSVGMLETPLMFLLSVPIFVSSLLVWIGYRRFYQKMFPQ